MMKPCILSIENMSHTNTQHEYCTATFRFLALPLNHHLSWRGSPSSSPRRRPPLLPPPPSLLVIPARAPPLRALARRRAHRLPDAPGLVAISLVAVGARRHRVVLHLTPRTEAGPGVGGLPCQGPVVLDPLFDLAGGGLLPRGDGAVVASVARVAIPALADAQVVDVLGEGAPVVLGDVGVEFLLRPFLAFLGVVAVFSVGLLASLFAS